MSDQEKAQDAYEWIFHNTIQGAVKPVSSFSDIQHVLLEGGDRGLVMWGHGLLHDSLEIGIRMLFVLDDEKKDNIKIRKYLFSTAISPLTSTHVRTEFAYALGVIGLELRKAISAGRKLRNGMAHPKSFEMITLAPSRVNDLIKFLPIHVQLAIDIAIQNQFPRLDSLQQTMEDVKKTFASDTLISTERVRAGIDVLHQASLLSPVRVRYALFALFSSHDVLVSAEQRAKSQSQSS